MQSTRGIGRAALPLLDFAPDEVYRMIPAKVEINTGVVTNTAVGSYPAFSPLPSR